MNGPSPMEERLRDVRTLIERAPSYRAVAGRCALVAGFLSIISAAIIYLNEDGRILGRSIRPRDFATIWIDVMFVSFAVSIFFVWLETRRSGRPFFSSELRLAFGQFVPYLLIPAAYTGWFFSTGYLGGQDLDLVVVWIVFYGLALLSTAVFAPRPIVLLGWAFLLTGLSVPIVTNLFEGYFSFGVPNALMGVTFGLYHLLYAVCNWPRKRETPAAQL